MATEEHSSSDSEPEDSLAEGGVMNTEVLACQYLKSFLGDSPYWLSGSRVHSTCDRDYEHLFCMLKKHPNLSKELFTGFSDAKTFPLGYMLAAKAPLGIIQKVYEMYPDALKARDNQGYLPLHDAIIYHCSSEVVAFLLEKYKGAAAMVIGDEEGVEGELPIQYLVQKVDEYDPDYFSNVFQLVYKAYRPNYRIWEYIQADLLMSPNVSPSFMDWLAKQGKNPDGYCCIDFGSFQSLNVETVIKNFKHFIPLLEVNHLRITAGASRSTRMDGAFLAKLFSEVAIPSNLSITIAYFNISLPPTFENLAKGFTSSQIESLLLSNIVMTPEDYNGLIRSFRSLPKLADLTIIIVSGSSKIPLTTSIIDLLEGSPPQLKRLHLVGYGLDIDVKKLCLALQESKSPTAYVTYYDYDAEEINKEIPYHSAMNRHGRTIITSSNATPKVLVDCICSLGGNYRRTPNLEQSVLYGLLRAAPGLWATTRTVTSSPSPTKKRRANNEPIVQSQSQKKMMMSRK